MIGTSGCGKSSLIRSGLIPSLHSGLMVKTGSSWRIALMRPGEDPIGQLAAALDHPDVLGQGGELASTSRVLLEATLRRGSLGIVDAVRHARLFRTERLIVIISASGFRSAAAANDARATRRWRSSSCSSKRQAERCRCTCADDALGLIATAAVPGLPKPE